MSRRNRVQPGQTVNVLHDCRADRLAPDVEGIRFQPDYPNPPAEWMVRHEADLLVDDRTTLGSGLTRVRAMRCDGTPVEIVFDSRGRQLKRRTT